MDIPSILSTSSPWSMGATVAAVMAISYMLLKPKGKKRRLSFTSQIMAAGAWPSGFDMAEPIINAVLTFDKLPSLDNVRSLIRQVMKYDRMGGVCTRDNSGAWGFDRREEPPSAAEVEKHLTVFEVHGQAEFWAKVHEICMGGLHSPDKAIDPWWEYVVLKNTGSGASGVIVRVHHTIGDGIALVGMVRAIMTDSHGKPIPDYFGSAKVSGGGGGGGGRGIGFLTKVASAAVHCLTLGMTKYDSPLVFTASDKKTMKYTGKRRTLLLPNVELAFVKALKDAATTKGQRTTVNDVLFSATTGAVRRYCQARDDPLLPRGGADREGEDTGGLQMRALLPVSFPRKASITDTAAALRNLWCFVSCPMPVGSGGALGRLAATRGITAKIKPPASFVAPVQVR